MGDSDTFVRKPDARQRKIKKASVPNFKGKKGSKLKHRRQTASEPEKAHTS